MRKITLVLTSLCVLAATPSFARGEGTLGMVEHLIVRHHLLTPAELACSSFVYGRKAVGEAKQVVVLERHGGRCPGDRYTRPTVRFSVFADPVSGAVQWNNPDATILEDLPLPGEAPTEPSIYTSCGVCAQP